MLGVSGGPPVREARLRANPVLEPTAAKSAMAVRAARQNRIFVIAITSRAHFCDRHHIMSAMAELASQLSIGTAYAVLTFDVPPKH
jgi:hypothetical protein